MEVSEPSYRMLRKRWQSVTPRKPLSNRLWRALFSKRSRYSVKCEQVDVFRVLAHGSCSSWTTSARPIPYADRIELYL